MKRISGITRLKFGAVDWIFFGVAILFVLAFIANIVFNFAPTSVEILLGPLAVLTTSFLTAQLCFGVAKEVPLASGIHCHSVGARFIGIAAICTALSKTTFLVGHMLANPLPPAIFDIVKLSPYLPAIVGLGFLIGAFHTTGRLRLLLDSALAAMSPTVPIIYYVLTPLIASAKGFHGVFIPVFHAIGDTSLVFFGTVLLVSSMRVKPIKFPVMALAGSTAAVGMANIAYTHLGIVKSGSDFKPWLSMAAPIGALVIAFSMIFWNYEPVETVDASEELRMRSNPLRSYLSLIGPFFFAIIAFGVVSNQELQAEGHVSASVFFIGCTLMGFIVLRQILTMIDNQRLGQQVVQFNDDLEQNVAKRTKQLQALYSMAKSVGNSLDSDGIVHGFVDHALLALNGDGIMINLAPLAATGQIQISELLFQRGLEDHPWVHVQLANLEKSWFGRSGSLHDDEFKHHAQFVSVPITHQGRNFGHITVVRWDLPFDASDIGLLEGVSAEVGTALENARLYEMAKLMADIDPVSGLLNHRAAQERFDFSFTHAEDQKEPLSILMVDVNNFKFFNDTYGHLAGDHVLKSIARVLKGSCRPHDVPARYGGDEFFVILPNTDRPAAEELMAVIQSSIAEEGFPEAGSDRIIPYSLSIGIACYPDEAKSRNELVYTADQDMYREKKLAHGANPVRKTARKPGSNSGESFDLLDSMVSAVDNKDYYTRAHSEEVTEYALWIAQELGLSEEAMKTIRNAGLLHDVGKIGIPDEILRKPGLLSDEEYDVMKQHPVVGAMIVSSIPGMADIIPGVRHHHERWDGKGYPDGLAGETIPLLARLLAVADTFSAMTTDRPYRKGMNWEVAISKIRQGTNTQFDASCVSAFTRAIDKRRHSLPQLHQDLDLEEAA